MSDRINYFTSPEVREARDLLLKSRDLYVYGLFDVLKLGIPPSEQLSKSLSKITTIGHDAAEEVEKYLASVDDSDNRARAKDPKDRARDIKAGTFREMFSACLAEHFAKDPAGQPTALNFIHRAEAFGKFVFTDAERNAFFQTELASLEAQFWSKKIVPFLSKYEIALQHSTLPKISPIPVVIGCLAGEQKGQ